MGRLVTITRCLDHTEALVIRGLLEQHGIVCVLDGEGLSSINPWMTAAIHGIGVQVMEEDAKDALLLISPFTEGALATPAGECCPSCGSDNIFRPDSFLLGVLVVALLGLLARRPTSSRICLVCRAKWRADKTGIAAE
ncbi:DUF2007 domain-containing protein [Emcibacter sp. SYSU 3D8]|uniref:putative signal transducing protein n=1 Tax=Emcibacter sp. SYSU 3D8 TaxID=3133969 RepID=UPI0031FEAF93